MAAGANKQAPSPFWNLVTTSSHFW